MNNETIAGAAVVAILILLFYFGGASYLNSIWKPTPLLTPDQRKKLLPTSGYEIPYSPMKWNIPPIMLSHNCYDYAFNNYDITQLATSQPGYLPRSARHESGRILSCAGVNERLNSDHAGKIKVADANTPCGQGEYKIALISDPDDDYHFLRQNRDGTWSHKPGRGFATNKDFAGNIIINPQEGVFKGDEFNYDNFCNYFCISRDIKKNFQ